MAIKFYRVHGEKYGCFSNFSPNGYHGQDGKWRHNSEAGFQAQKFAGINNERYEYILSLKKPSEAAKAGRSRDFKIVSDWENKRDDAMYDELYHKFTSPFNAEALRVLISTGDEELIEDSPIDYYWGIGKNGTGQNKLGKLLMNLREELKATGYDL